MNHPHQARSSPQYTVIRKIGEGSFSQVFEVVRPSKEIQCLKVVKQDGGKGISIDILREITILSQLQSEWVVQLKEVSEDTESQGLLVFYQPMETDLRRFLDSTYLRSGAIKKICRNILLGLEFMHSRGIVHRDLKPSNLLVDSKLLHVRIADMGFATRLNLESAGKENVLVGTVPYLAPEQLSGEVYFAYQTDVWSLGCVLAEMVLRRPLFASSDATTVSSLQKVFLSALFPGLANEHVPLQEISDVSTMMVQQLAAQLGEEGLDVVRRMLAPEMGDRDHPGDLLCHSFFK